MTLRLGLGLGDSPSEGCCLREDLLVYSGMYVSDEDLVGRVSTELESYARRADRPPLALVETAGGPASPGPTGKLQVGFQSPVPPA